MLAMAQGVLKSMHQQGTIIPSKRTARPCQEADPLHQAPPRIGAPSAGSGPLLLPHRDQRAIREEMLKLISDDQGTAEVTLRPAPERWSS